MKALVVALARVIEQRARRSRWLVGAARRAVAAASRSREVRAFVRLRVMRMP
jgi:hypothetical protein